MQGHVQGGEREHQLKYRVPLEDLIRRILRGRLGEGGMAGAVDCSAGNDVDFDRSTEHSEGVVVDWTRILAGSQIHVADQPDRQLNWHCCRHCQGLLRW